MTDLNYTRCREYRYNVGDVANPVAPNGNTGQVFPPEQYVDLLLADSAAACGRAIPTVADRSQIRRNGRPASGGECAGRLTCV